MPTVVRLCSVILLFFTKFRVRGNIKVRINTLSLQRLILTKTVTKLITKKSNNCHYNYKVLL